jgi:hypothetical protein
MPTKSLSVVILAVVAVAPSCADPDSVVLVQVVGSVSGIYRLRSVVSVGGETRSFDVPQAPRSIPLPTSYTIQIDRSMSGPLDVQVTALDAGEQELASGAASLPALLVGQVNEVLITLGPAPYPDRDGEVDVGGGG